MDKINDKQKGNLIIIALVVIIAYFAVLIIKPLITVLLTSAVIAFVFYPLYKAVKFIFRNATISAIVSSIVIVLLIVIPLTVMILSVQQEAVSTYNWARSSLEATNTTSIVGSAKIVVNFIDKHNLDTYLNIGSLVGKASTTFVGWISAMLLAIPKLLFDVFIMLFLIYYFFKDGEKMLQALKEVLSLKKNLQDEIFAKIGKIIHAIVWGNLMLSLLEGALGGVLLWLLGVKAPILWALLIALCALIPFVGTGIVWIPISAYLAYAGLNDGTWYKGIILFVYCVVFFNIIDNILKPKIIGKKAEVHPIVIFLGVIGGVIVFGFVGIILGPLLLAIMATIIHAYAEMKNDT